ncbi:MAG: sugar ABC transporter substrate-binding protein [Lapillicoccus sp.]
MQRRLTTLSLASVTATVLLTSGCISGSGGSPGADGAATTAAPGEKVALTFSSYAFQDLTVKATQNIVDTWNAANPDIHVDYQKVDPNSVHDKLVTQFAGNQAPDIIHDESADIAGFSSQGFLADLTPLLPADLKSDVPASVWKTTTFNGKITGVPTIAQVYNVFANTDVLQKAGIPLPTTAAPWTWDDLAVNAKKLTTGGDVYGFAWGLKSPTAGLMSSGLSYDGTFFSGDESKPSIDVGAKEMEVPTRVKKMLDDKVMAPNSISLSGTDVLPGFFGGKYGLVMAGNYVEAQIEAKAPAGFSWTMLPLLKGTSQNQAAGPQTLSIARQSKHPAEAMKFIAYFMKADNLAKVAEGDALIPVTTSASAIVKKDLAGKHGWDNILGASANLVDSPWNKATKFPQWKSETATPAYQEYLAGKIDAAALQQRLKDGWTKISG